MGKQITIAVVDDESEAREAYREFFTAKTDFCFVGEADNGRDGVALYRSQHPDVMLMDLNMPIMSGTDAIAAICGQDQLARVIALTTFGTRDFIVAALRAGAAGYLMKDCGRDELVQAIHQAMAGEMPLSSGVRLALVNSMKEEPVTTTVTAPSVTPQETELLRCLALGMGNREISQTMYVSEGTVKQYLNHIADKLGVRSRTQILVRALQLHIVDLDENKS